MEVKYTFKSPKTSRYKVGPNGQSWATAAANTHEFREGLTPEPRVLRDWP